MCWVSLFGYGFEGATSRLVHESLPIDVHQRGPLFFTPSAADLAAPRRRGGLRRDPARAIWARDAGGAGGAGGESRWSQGARDAATVMLDVLRVSGLQLF